MYSIIIDINRITVTASGIRGAFYVVHTLRQIFTHDRILCLCIEDKPDFAYRGFYTPF